MAAPWNFSFHHQHNRDDEDKPVDMIWFLRGGGTDVYTLISSLARLQKLLPNDHLSASMPYILADSAGAYPASGLVVPNPVDPIKLPLLFKNNIARYLSRNRAEAEAALIEEIGPIRLNETALPVCISTTEITSGLGKAYFRFFPATYLQGRPGFIPPANANETVKLADAVLASSAFAAILGDYRIEERRFMDMAFLETHAANLSAFAINHARSCPDRRLVCVVFGNLYSDFRIKPEEKLSLKGLNRHFADAIRATVQTDIVQNAKTLLGKENVFDLSLYVEQPFSEKPQPRLPNAFRSDPLAIQERIRWTDEMLDKNEGHQATLEDLAVLIHRNALPGSSVFSPQRAPSPVEDIPVLAPLTRQQKILSARHDFRLAAGLAAELVRDHTKPLIEKAMPFVQASWKAAIGATRWAGNELARGWDATENWRAARLQKLEDKLLPPHPRHRTIE